MANAADGAQKPVVDDTTKGAVDTTTTATTNDGSRADTSRVVDGNGGTPQDGDTKVKDGKVFTFKEDRSDWVPRTRLREETGKRAKLEQNVAALQAQLDQNDKRLRAALGVETPSKEQQELHETRELFFTAFPEFAHLKDLTQEDIQEILEAARSAQGTSQATWKRHSTEMRSDLEDIAAGLLRADKLSEQQSNRLWRAFKEEAREQAKAYAKAERDEDSSFDFENSFVSRYERGDKALLEEFAKAFYEEWVVPARRQATAAVVSRQNRPVPRGERNRPHLTQGPPNINYNDDNAFKDAMKSARAGGGEV